MKLPLPTLDSLKWLVATLAIPLTMSYLGYAYQQANSRQQSLEARLRLYTELLSKREQADTDLRKDMFTKVLEKFLTPANGDVASSIDALELLTLNFHDSLNLSPLFHQLDKRIAALNEPERAELGKQLMRVAKLVKERQSDMLASVGKRVGSRVDLASITTAPQTLFQEVLEFDVREGFGGTKHYSHKFLVEVIDHQAARKRVLLKVSFDDQQLSFWVDPFDFPLVNYSRLSSGARMAVVMTDYSSRYAKLDFLYFPSSRSGVSDKPFIDEVVANLLEEQK